MRHKQLFLMSLKSSLILLGNPNCLAALEYAVCVGLHLLLVTAAGHRWRERQLTLEWLDEDRALHCHRFNDVVIQQDLNVVQSAKDGNTGVSGSNHKKKTRNQETRKNQRARGVQRRSENQKI